MASTWDRIIFVGCLPVGTMVDLDLSTLLAPYQRRIEREGGKVNGREVSAVPYWNLLDYAQGPKRVAAALMADMFSGKAPTWRTLYVDPYDLAPVRSWGSWRPCRRRWWSAPPDRPHKATRSTTAHVVGPTKPCTKKKHGPKT